MQTSSRYILLLGVGAALTSMLYFFSLLLCIPFPVCIVLVLVMLLFLFRWFSYKNVVFAPHKIWPAIVLAAGAFLISQKASAVAIKYGEWDAWAMWNYHAIYLEDAHNWKKMFQNVRFDHADYPLCVSAFLAFMNRLLTGHYSSAIPFAFGYLFALAIPIIVYVETANKNIVIAIFALYFFYQDVFFLSRAVSQYADTLLAFFFMGAFICMNYAEDKRMIVLCALLLGCCTWTKNEGVILSGVFCLFYAPVFLKNIKHFAVGILFPAITLIVYKSINPVHSDMLSKDLHYTKTMLLNSERYKTVWDAFKLTLRDKFNYLKLGVFLYAVLCFIEKKLPNKQMLIILTCLLIYSLVYVITPEDINWHIATSQDRLLHQLMPAMMYVLASKFSDIQFSLPGLKKAV